MLNKLLCHTTISRIKCSTPGTSKHEEASLKKNCVAGKRLKRRQNMFSSCEGPSLWLRVSLLKFWCFSLRRDPRVSTGGYTLIPFWGLQLNPTVGRKISMHVSTQLAKRQIILQRSNAVQPIIKPCAKSMASAPEPFGKMHVGRFWISRSGWPISSVETGRVI